MRREHGSESPPRSKRMTAARHVPGAPRIRAMRQSECLSMLRRHNVGRLAFSFHDRVDIAPIHYVYSEGWLFARTAHGAKMTTVAHVPWVAIEVDDVHGVFEWKSVVVHGTIYTMQRDAGPTEARLWRNAISALRRVVPETGTADDPVPWRSLVFGIHIDRMTGRAARPASG